MKRSSPLRFLAMVLGGWAALRTVIIAPPWSTLPADAAATGARVDVGASGAAGQALAMGAAPGVPDRSDAEPAATSPAATRRIRIGLGSPRRARPKVAWVLPIPVRTSRGSSDPERGAAPPPPSPKGFSPAPGAVAAGARPGRWSLSAWSFVRRGWTAPTAGGGLLGGSQAGARLTYRVNGDRTRPLALSARLSTPLGRTAGAEAALGLDWRPSRRLPVHILAERRQALGEEGRSAFGLTFHGGVGDAPVGRFRLDAYAQAGAVGLRSRDPFADGSIRLSLPLGPRGRLGAGAWAAAQPGASRLDLGPQAALRVTVAGRDLTVAADWRLRVAGKAEPGSGPTLTLASDF